MCRLVALLFFAFEAIHGAVPCPSALYGANRISDPSLLPERAKIVRSEPLLFGPTTQELAGLKPVDLAVSSALLPISGLNLIYAYSHGWKLYHHFDIEGSVPEWQSPQFRGIINFEHTRGVLRTSGFLKELKKLTQGQSGRPIYDIRFNSNPSKLLWACGNAERAMQNTVTKEVVHDPTGKTLRWKKTWLSSEIQGAFLELIEKGLGYSIEIYTNELHPYHYLSKDTGHMVAGTFGIGWEGTFTGISVYLNREPHPDKPNRLAFDGAGKLAFFAEIDTLEAQGARWLDAVTVNALPREVGAYFVRREEFDELRATDRVPQRFIVPPGRFDIRFDYWRGVTSPPNSLK